MANNSSVNTGIKNAMSLLAFARSHGKMQVADFVNRETGEPFKSCIFTNPTDMTRTFVSFSQKLGELTPLEIKQRQHDLQVVELQSGNFKLCDASNNTWQDVDLDL